MTRLLEHTTIRWALLAMLCLFSTGTLPAQDPHGILRLPPRPADSVGASRLLELARNFTPRERDDFLAREILSGNIPNSLRSLSTVRIQRVLPGQTTPTLLTLQCTPDYLAIGSDEDGLRVPLRPATAQRIADATDSTLPTRSMVDSIAAEATYCLAPLPMSPKTYPISDPEVWMLHESLLEAQASRVPGKDIPLRRGVLKDIVITNELARRPLPERVAIYGWHYPNGRPIQPLTLVHNATYLDYSHGTRLVSRRAMLNGRVVDLQGVLASPGLSALVSDEGTVETGRYPLAYPPRVLPWVQDQ